MVGPERLFGLVITAILGVGVSKISNSLLMPVIARRVRLVGNIQRHSVPGWVILSKAGIHRCEIVP
jgi:hypothetical protein